jgi:UDP-N-acetylglucosamine:LPS N-acetylglucosamine transferase
VHPAAVITTGAAPGLVALFAAKLCGVKTIWIDSVANVEHLSASGRVARKFADRVYTQWENLSTDNIYYKGNIFG